MTPDGRAMRSAAPRVHRRVTGSTSVDARELAIAGAPARHARHRARAARRPRPPGPPLGRARRAARCCARSCCATRRRCCRSPPASRSPSWSAPRRDAEVAQRRAARRAQGRRDPDRGPPAGALGGARDRRQRRGRARGAAAPSCARAPARWGSAREAIEPSLERLLERSSAGSRRPPARSLDAWRARDALLGAPSLETAAAAPAPGIDERGRLLVAPRRTARAGARRRRGAPRDVSAR